MGHGTAGAPVGVWLVAGPDEPYGYPCACDRIDPDPPGWLRERYGRDPVPACRPYLAKRGRWAGRWTSYCPCWGMDPTGRPENCCAHHQHNPRFAPQALLMLATLPPAREAGWQAPHERAEREVVDAEVSTAYADALGIPLDVEPEPYRRRWSPEELHCACPTPWDHLITKTGKVAEKGIGMHCTSCCRNFRNPQVASLHQKKVTDPCRDPATVVDPERGTRVFRMRVEGPFVIWA